MLRQLNELYIYNIFQCIHYFMDLKQNTKTKCDRHSTTGKVLVIHTLNMSITSSSI